MTKLPSSITPEQFDGCRITARDLGDPYVVTRFEGMSLLQLFDYRRRALDVTLKLHLITVIEARERDPYRSYLGKPFRIAAAGAAVCNAQGQPIQYRQGDAIPPGRQAGDDVVIAPGTYVHVTEIMNDLSMVYAEDHGWIQRTRIEGEMLNETLGMTQAPYTSSEPEHYTIGNPRALIRTGRRYRSTGRSIPQGRFVILKQLSENSRPPGLYGQVAYTRRSFRGELSENVTRGAVWTTMSNLVSGWADYRGPHAAWKRSRDSKTKGNYIGQIDIVRIIGWDSDTLEAEVEHIAAGTLEPYSQLCAAAAESGHAMRINSAFRTYAEQRDLWTKYLDGNGAKAARPGLSNHQNGIAFDLNTKSFTSPLYQWMTENAPRHGFIRTVGGEHWHWEYRPADAAAHGYKMPGLVDPASAMVASDDAREPSCDSRGR